MKQRMNFEFDGSDFLIELRIHLVSLTDIFVPGQEMGILLIIGIVCILTNSQSLKVYKNRK